MEQKTFCKILTDFNESPRKVRDFFKDKRLTLLEKKILQGYLLVRDNQNKDVIELMEETPSSPFAFIEAQKKLLLGIAYNNLTHFEVSKTYLNESTELFKQLSLPYFEFIGHFNLFVIAYNNSLVPDMKKILEHLENLKTDNIIQGHRLLRMKFMYYSHIKDNLEANKLLLEIERVIDDFKESDISSHLVCLFMYHLENERLELCQSVINRMKKHRKYQMTENFNFMKKLLNHYMYDEPLYEYGTTFGSIPILNYQFNVIQAFEENDRAKALTFWKKLQDISPKDYGDSFLYEGRKNLFSLCLNKYLQKKHTPEKTLRSPSNKLDHFILLLKQHTNGISKEKMFELIWGSPLKDKDDLMKLAKLAHRAKHTKGLIIKTRKGNYILESSDVPAKRTLVS